MLGLRFYWVFIYPFVCIYLFRNCLSFLNNVELRLLFIQYSLKSCTLFEKVTLLHLERLKTRVTSAVSSMFDCFSCSFGFLQLQRRKRGSAEHGKLHWRPLTSLPASELPCFFVLKKYCTSPFNQINNLLSKRLHPSPHSFKQK